MTQAFTQTHAHDLRVRLSGPVVASGDTEYEEVRKIWNASIDNRPAAFARCTGYEDVVAALKLRTCTTWKLPVAVAATTSPAQRWATAAW